MKTLMFYICNAVPDKNENGLLLIEDSLSHAARNLIWGLISGLEKLGYKHIQTDLPFESIRPMHSSHF